MCSAKSKWTHCSSSSDLSSHLASRGAWMKMFTFPILDSVGCLRYCLYHITQFISHIRNLAVGLRRIAKIHNDAKDCYLNSRLYNLTLSACSSAWNEVFYYESLSTYAVMITTTRMFNYQRISKKEHI